jgi:hypothetical protein
MLPENFFGEHSVAIVSVNPFLAHIDHLNLSAEIDIVDKNVP